jgi:hypothetical protein
MKNVFYFISLITVILCSEIQCAENADKILSDYANRTTKILDQISDNKRSDRTLLEIDFSVDESKKQINKLFKIIENDERISSLIKNSHINSLEIECVEDKKNQERNYSKENKEELRDRKAFTIREYMIDECINSCKMLTEERLTYSKLYYAFINVFPLYDKRKEYNTAKDINDEYLDNAMKSIWYPQYKNKEESQLFYSCQNIHSPVPALNTPPEAKGIHAALKASFQAFKEDVIESMNIYERLHERIHPRKEEVAQMSWLERSWG